MGEYFSEHAPGHLNMHTLPDVFIFRLLDTVDRCEKAGGTSEPVGSELKLREERELLAALKQ